MLSKAEATSPDRARRRFITTCGAFAAAFAAGPLLAHAKPENERTIHLLNEHTGERIKTVYWEQGEYIGENLQAIDRLLRDHRTGDTHPMDVTLLDNLHRLHQKLGGRGEFRIISGYRSPKTNAMLRKTTTGVAKRSLHMEGRALDVHLHDRPLSKVRAAAQALRMGGVGYYPKSGFIHIDTGAVRYWS